MHHNEICDLTASSLTEVCSNVAVESELQQLNNEVQFCGGSANRNNGAHLDITADAWFWGPGRERTFLDSRVFNLLAISSSKS